MGNIFSNPGLAVGQLPGVTASDSGKTLVVNENGEWVVGDSGGGGSGAGGNVFVVTVTDGETSGHEADATFSEIIAAIEAEQTCVAQYTDGDGRTIILHLTSYKSGSSGSVTFGHTLYGGAVDSTGLYVKDFYVEIGADDYVTAHTGKLRGVEITG